MTNICGLCNLKRNTCSGSGKHGKVERQDGIGKILELLQSFQGAAGVVGLSDQDHHLPPKLGKIYYHLRPGAGAQGESTMVMVNNKDQQAPAAGTKRIKVVITKQQLRQLVSDMKWRSELQSIPEEDEYQSKLP